MIAVPSSGRELLHLGYGAAAALGVSALAPAGALGPVRALAQGAPASNASAEDFFYREDWFGEPWSTPETAVLIHANDETSIVWYGCCRSGPTILHPPDVHLVLFPEDSAHKHDSKPIGTGIQHAAPAAHF